MNINSYKELVYYLNNNFPDIDEASMMVYLDFDGVIKDTIPTTFDDLLKGGKFSDFTRAEVDNYLSKLKWIEVIKNSPVIDDAYDVLKELDPMKFKILTKCSVGYPEIIAKRIDLLDNKVPLQMIDLDFDTKKTDKVSADNCLLVDDNIKNCGEWLSSSGIPLFFDNNKNGLDSFGHSNDKYPYTRSLKIFLK